MRVLLTGATGFIGSAVARRVAAEGAQVLALVRPGADLRRLAPVRERLQLLEGDVFQPAGLESLLRAHPPDLCLHLAWHAVPGQYLQADENLDCVQGSLDLLRLLDAVGCPRTLIAGTCFEYDTDLGYLSEGSSVCPASVYAASKHALFLIADQFQRQHGRSLAWARIFYQYGPWEDGRRLVPLVVRKLLASEPLHFSEGSQVRDFLHVDDVAAAIWAVACSKLEGPVNIGSSRPVTVAEVALEIAGQLARRDLLKLGARPNPPGDPPFIVANTSRLRDVTGWSPRYSLEEGIADTIAWWRAQPDG